MTKKKEQGPALESLLSRLAETPEDFLRTPSMISNLKNTAGVSVSAVVSDLVFDVGGNFPEEEESKLFELDRKDRNRNYLGIILVLCHLLHDEWFLGKKEYAGCILEFLGSGKIWKLSKIVKYQDFIADPERREELARLALDGLKLIPEGENKNRAADRLITLDSVERKRIIKKTRDARKRAQELREAMARKQAEEAASKMSRE